MRGADDDHIVRHNRRGVQPNFAGDQIDFLVVVELQVHQSTALPKLGTGLPVLASSATRR